MLHHFRKFLRRITGRYTTEDYVEDFCTALIALCDHRNMRQYPGSHAEGTIISATNPSLPEIHYAFAICIVPGGCSNLQPQQQQATNHSFYAPTTSIPQ